MNDPRWGMGLAFGAGYALGRTRKARLVFAIGAAVVGVKLRLGPRAVAEYTASRLREHPEIKEIGEQLRDDLRGVGKAAARSLADRQVHWLADHLQTRALAVRDRTADMLSAPSRPLAPDEADAEGEGEGDDEDGPPSDGANGPRRTATRTAPAKKAAKRAPARKAAAGKATGESPKASGAPAKKTAKRTAAKTSARKAPAKKTAARRTTTAERSAAGPSATRKSDAKGGHGDE